MNNKINVTARAVLALNLAVYCGFSVGFTLWPNYLATLLLGAQFASPAGAADLRAVYAGLSGGAGYFILRGILFPVELLPALRLSVYLATGLAVQRLLAFGFGGGSQVFNLYTSLSLLSEVFAATLGLILLHLAKRTHGLAN